MSQVANIERTDFTGRLQQALRNADFKPNSPTILAKEFNVRFDGKPITIHAARKWIVGEAIPTQQKLRTLAQWLGVTPEWLRFGTGTTDAPAMASMNPAHVKFLNDLQQLDQKSQEIAREFVRMMVRMKSKQ